MRPTSRKGLLLAFAIGGVLTLASLVNVVHVLAVSYDAIQYGFPLPWLVYLVDTLGPVHRWIVTPAFILVYAFWAVIAYAGVISVTTLKRVFEPAHLSGKQ